jgi:hypothetical protein
MVKSAKNIWDFMRVIVLQVMGAINGIVNPGSAAGQVPGIAEDVGIAAGVNVEQMMLPPLVVLRYGDPLALTPHIEQLPDIPLSTHS